MTEMRDLKYIVVTTAAYHTGQLLIVIVTCEDLFLLITLKCIEEITSRVQEFKTVNFNILKSYLILEISLKI